MKNKYTTRHHYLLTGDHRLRLDILTPDNLDENNPPPVALWIHGGGYFSGSSKMVHISRAKDLVRKFGLVVVAPNYRLSGDAPYPAALLDCYATLKFIKQNFAKLKINPNQIIVGGESAGGGLTAAVCMLARDIGEIKISMQVPLYPMLDDRLTSSSVNNTAPIWNTKRNRYAWLKYLKGLPLDSIPAYAAPARQTDYTNLPPAYSFVGDIEPFYFETLEYIANLKAAGVPAVVDVYNQCYHAFDIVNPYDRNSKVAISNFEKQFELALNKYVLRND